jgi:hypothetical protein
VSYSHTETDILAFPQFFSHFGRDPLGPEETLMLAVLNDAIECLQKYSCGAESKSERLFLEAVEWMLECDADWPFSFENICDALRLDPNYMRRGLLTQKRLETRARLHTARPRHRRNLTEVYLLRIA